MDRQPAEPDEIEAGRPVLAAAAKADGDNDNDADADDDDVDEFEFDSIFAELGECGRYQTIVYVLMGIAIMMYGHVTLTYVFTAGDLNYRCRVPLADCSAVAAVQNCDEYLAGGSLVNLVPLSAPSGLPAKCQRFVSNITLAKLNADRVASNSTAISAVGGNFTADQLIGCADFVYETEEINILREFNLQCSENDWKRTIVGSANNAALFVGLPIFGYLSDRFGRKNVFIWGLFSCAVAGLLKSFATSYAAFLTLEVLDAFLGSGTFMVAYVLAMELVGPTKRTLTGILINCFYNAGLMLLGLYASLFSDYHIWLRFCYAPALSVIVYHWIIPESTRWLFCVNRRIEGARNIKKAARFNGVTLSAGFEKKLRRYCQAPVRNPRARPTESVHLFQSGRLVWRMITCCTCWFVNSFVAYGLTLNSVDLAGDNKHLNFILMSAIEIPSCLCMYFAMNRMGRRWLLCSVMLLTGACCAGTMLTPYPFTFFLLGKFAITASFSILYVYTAEIFPTAMRNRLMSSCSMVGRLGSMLAPQMPLLARYMESLPLILYSSSAILTGLMVLNFPETFNTKLPDTIEDALNVGRTKKDNDK